MAISPPVQLTDFSKYNSLFDNGAIANEQLRNSILGQQAEQMGLQNEFTRAVQPAQINDLLSLSNPQVASSSGQAQSPGDTSGGPPGLAVNHVQPGESLLSGEMPTAKDGAAQQRVMQIAQEEGVNPPWAGRVMHRETGKEPNSMAARGASGEIGTMQLLPSTAADLKVDPTNPDQNARGGVRYLKQMKDQFGDPVIATAAYNAGPRTVQKWLAGQGPLPDHTVQYVGDVFGGNGIQLLNNAMGGGHGHAVGGISTAGTGGLQTVQMDDAARAEVKRLILMRNIAMRQPDGKGARAAAGFQQALDNIAGPGGVPDSVTGNVYRAPGSFATRYAAAQAQKAGEVGPLTQLDANKAGIAVQQHAGEKGIDLQFERNRPAAHPAGTQIYPQGVAPDVSAPTLQPSTVPINPPPMPQQQPGTPQPPAQQQTAQAGPPSFQTPPNLQKLPQELYEEDRKKLEEVGKDAATTEASMVKALEQRRILQGLPTGAGGEARTKWANYAETFLPPDMAAKFKQALTLPDAAPAQEYAKLSLQNAGNQERQVLGARGGYRAIQLYQQANPSMELQSNANRDIHNMQLVAMQADRDYASGLHQWVNGQRGTLQSSNQYRPSSEFDQQWLDQHNPQVYVGAIAAMNDKPFAEWSKGLSPEEAKRALQIIARVDPTTVVQGRKDKLPVASYGQPTRTGY